MEKETRARKDSDYVPEEVLTLILSSLPVKSLLRLRCVSKSCNSLITSTFFINKHLHETKTTGAYILFHRYRKSFDRQLTSCSLYFDNTSSELELPCKSEDHTFVVIGSCNGVVCLLDTYEDSPRSLILWNPSIRKSLKLPPPRSNGHRAVWGFGFDSLSKDYKVARVVKTRSEIAFQVYSLNAKSWKTIDVNPSLADVCLVSSMIHVDCTRAVANEVIYWLLFLEMNGDMWGFLLSFDLRNESFEEISLPESLGPYRFGSVISAFDNSLAVLKFDMRFVDVWVMKECGQVKSWTKQLRMKLVRVKMPFLLKVEGEMPLLFGRSGKILYYILCSKLVFLDLQRQGICDYLKNLDLRQQDLHVDYFVESLALLDQPNEIYRGQEEVGGRARIEDHFLSS